MMVTQGDYANPTRRQVITTASATGAIVGIEALIGASQAQPGKTPHVVIVGAGLAGLCAAYLLQQKNWTYTILEAERHHVGGRIRTRPMGDGLHWEAGAMRIPKEHRITRKYIDMFSELELRPFVMYSSKTFKFARGSRSTDEAEIKKKFRMKADEAKLTSDQLWQLTVKDVAQGKSQNGLSPDELEQLRTANTFTSEKLIKFDRQSLRQLIQEAKPKQLGGVPLSDEAIEFFLFAYGNLSIQHGASTEFLREENIGVWDPGFSEIKGGTSRFPNAFLSRLTSKPKMGCEVIRIEQDKAHGRARAVYRVGGRDYQEEGDFLICTIPFPILARIETDPPFSYEKQRAIIELGYDSGTKVALWTKNRFWEKNNGIYGGSTTTDLISGAIIYPSDNALDADGTKPRDPAVSDQPGVFLACYTWGQDARRLGAMPATEREDLVIQQVSQIHPELQHRDMILGRASWAWDTYRWCGGAFAFYQPGQFTRIHQHVIAPEGRIYFAGEHCSHSHSWMQGALESAESAVAALLARAG
jgi:monoamine oxidase